MKIYLFTFSLLFLVVFVACQKNTPSVKTTSETISKPVFDDGYPNQVTDAMLDSIFDFYFIIQHKNLCERAKLRFEQELKRVLSIQPIDSLALLQVHRRLAVVNSMYLDSLKTAYHITQALDLVEKIPQIEPIEKAKTYETKAMQLVTMGERLNINNKEIYSWKEKGLNLMLKHYGKKHFYTILLRTKQQHFLYYFFKNANIDTVHSILSDLKELPYTYPLVESILFLSKANILSDTKPKEALIVFNENRILLDKYVANHPFYNEFLSRMARCYYKLGDAKSGMELYDLAYNAGKDSYTKDDGSLMSCLSMAALCANRLNDYEKAFRYTLLCYKKEPHKAINISGLANCYFNLGDSVNSRIYLEKTIISCKNLQIDVNQKYKALETAIYLYTKIGDVKKTEFCVNMLYPKLLDLNNKVDASSSIYCALALLYSNQQHNFDKALRYIEAAYQYGEATDYIKIDADNTYLRIIIEQVRCKILFEKYKTTKKLTDLYTATKALSFVFELWDKYALETDGKGIKKDTYFTDDDRTIIEQAIHFNLWAGDWKTSFYWYESGRKQMLRLSGNDKISYEQFGIPKVLIEKEKVLREELAQLDPKMKQNKNSDVNIQKTFLYKKRELNNVLSSLEKKYPNYYQLKYDSKPASLDTIQREVLDNQTALIEYFVGDSTIYVFTVLKNDLKALEIKKPKDFSKAIENFRNEIIRPQPIHDATNFAKKSTELYDLLLRGCLETLPKSVNKLIIAPDDVLSYLPFEILIPNNIQSRDFRKNDFLLKHYQISYAYSANLLLEQKRAKKHDATQVFAGFAPKYEDKDTLISAANITSRAALTRDGAYELKGAKDEVNAISQLINGKIFAEASATEGAFKQEANRYKILHFAMHSLTDDKEPMFSKLLFTMNPKDTTQDGDLTAGELYAMQFNADLAVLSACNTGFGAISRGEGVMSLARAFTYAGVPATVTSLWKVPDLTTREIMVEFYKNLKQGMTKDAALRQAKLTYLDNTPESIAANPYFWAGFVPMGNMAAMDLSEPSPLSIPLILGGLVALWGLGSWFYQNRNRY